MACGMAAESGEPVVLSCTGATASRNYMPGLTEAYYRKLPVLAITSHRGDDAIGHLLDQQIDRRSIPADIVMTSVTVPLARDKREEKYCEIEATKAILALKYRGGGPAHINLFTSYSQDFSVKSLPIVRTIERYTPFDNLPEISQGKRVAVFIGSHKPFSSEATSALDSFCAAHDAVVFCDHTSGYHGSYEIHYSLVFCQEQNRSPLLDIDLLIHIGEVSGDVANFKIKEVWRVSEDGALRDTLGKLSKVFEMPESFFFQSFTPSRYEPKQSYFLSCKEEYESTKQLIPELPFGNIWIAQTIATKIPEGSAFFMGIYNSLRSYNYFELNSGVEGSSNVGGFGIDGGISTLIGASLSAPNRIHIGVFGDLAFFYDLNSMGNRHVRSNVRILLVNNGRGTEFRNYGHICTCLGESADSYVAAAGHYGNQSRSLVKHYAEDLGYNYYSASSKEEFQESIPYFLSPELTDKPILFEVFTDSKDESEAIRILRNLLIDKSFSMKTKIERAIKGAIGVKGVSLVKRVLRD